MDVINLEDMKMEVLDTENEDVLRERAYTVLRILLKQDDEEALVKEVHDIAENDIRTLTYGTVLTMQWLVDFMLSLGATPDYILETTVTALEQLVGDVPEGGTGEN